MTHTPPPLAVADLLARWLPGRRLVITRAASGGSTPVYQVDDQDHAQRWYLRLGEAPGDHHAAEAAVHQRLRSAGVPVPAVVRWEREPHELDRGAMLTGAIPGVPLVSRRGESATDWQAAQRAAGATLPIIGAVLVRGFGWVIGVNSAGELVAANPTRRAWVAEYAVAAATVRRAALLPKPVATAVAASVARWVKQPDTTIGALAHGDWDDNHLFVDPERRALTGLIDFGEIRGADPDYDLAHALCWGGGPDLPFDWTAIAAGAGLTGDVGRRQRVMDMAVAIGVRQLAISVRQQRTGQQALGLRLAALIERGPAVTAGASPSRLTP